MAVHPWIIVLMIITAFGHNVIYAKVEEGDKGNGKGNGNGNGGGSTGDPGAWNTGNVTDCRTEKSAEGVCLDVDTSVTAEHVLSENLFAKYDKNVRPVFNFTFPVQVSFGLKLSKIVKMDNVEQLLLTSVWITQKWLNPYLTWDKTLYGGVDVIHVSPDDIWVPDIVLYNNFEDEYAMAGHVEKFRTNVIIDHHGRNTWLIPTSFRSSCRLDIAFFPFDTQICNMTFGSWTLNAKELVMDPLEENAFISELYSSNGNWEVKKIRVSQQTRLYTCCKVPFSDVTFEIQLLRKPMYYVLYLLVPAVVISALNLLIFVIPVETGERLGLCVTVLLTMSVFLLLVQENLPETSEKVPLVGVFCIVGMLINSAILVCAVIVMNCYHSKKKPWRILRALFVRKKAKVHPIVAVAECNIKMMQSFGKELHSKNDGRGGKLGKEEEMRMTEPSKKKNKLKLGKFPTEEETKEKWMKEWEEIGNGLDRFFFWFFFVLLIGSGVAVYMNASYITHFDNLA